MHTSLIIHSSHLHYFSMELHQSIMSPSPPSIHPHSLNLLGLLSETKRIITAHDRHFLALADLFLFPVSFFVAIFNFPFQPYYSTTSNIESLFDFSSPDNFEFPNKTQLVCQLLYALSMFLFSLFASVSITNSTFHGFSGRPVKIVSSLKSIRFSFFPLLATILSVQFVILMISISFGTSTFCMYKVLVFFGVDMDYNSSAFIVFASFISTLYVCVLVFLHTMFYLVHVVVVVESKWGFEALKRSTYLVKGMRGVVFLMLMLFGVLVGFLSMMCSVLMPDVDEYSSGEWVGWPFVVQTVVYLSFMMILMLYRVAANTVLFMYCKALHGQLALDIVDEFSKEYEILPFDDDKIPQVVCVV